MMKEWAFPNIKFLFIVLMFFSVCLSVDGTQEDPVMLLKIIELKSGLKLRYTLSLPRSYSPAESYPLVVALHYGGKVTPFYSKDFMVSLVSPALQDLDAILVAPDCPARGWSNSVSEAAVLELILTLMGDYDIESNRILLLGYSMGGLGAWYLAARHPDLFAAAIPISALVDESTTPIIKDVPLHLIHGDQDELFPTKDVRALYHKQKTGGAEIELMIVEGASHYQIDRFIIPLRATISWIEKIWEER